MNRRRNLRSASRFAVLVAVLGVGGFLCAQALGKDARIQVTTTGGTAPPPTAPVTTTLPNPDPPPAHPPPPSPPASHQRPTQRHVQPQRRTAASPPPAVRIVAPPPPSPPAAPVLVVHSSVEHATAPAVTRTSHPERHTRRSTRKRRHRQPVQAKPARTTPTIGPAQGAGKSAAFGPAPAPSSDERPLFVVLMLLGSIVLLSASAVPLQVVPTRLGRQLLPRRLHLAVAGLTLLVAAAVAFTLAGGSL
jgi:hypothetical protein